MTLSLFIMPNKECLSKYNAEKTLQTIYGTFWKWSGFYETHRLSCTLCRSNIQHEFSTCQRVPIGLDVAVG